ncbi:phage tail tape measure protein [Aeromonas sp. HMWF036]|uniref:phage tail tape measure protein n=1 Tax=Aeromonas TaxID=642 RepID=UPI00067D66CF|nr:MULTISPECIES: phage tail tape measure protein [Aeromonas]PTS79741.1 phage tail tape measure protein [Aeromonas sp. HMWF036]PTT30265.1 phage tail tape measure protein [Aeromonas sp. HMWF017]
MANKKLSATITIGGAVASSLKSAFGSVKGGVNEVGSAIRYAERQQKLLSRSIQTFGKQGRNVDGLRQKYVAITSQIDRLREAHQRLNRIKSQQRENGADRRELGGKIANTATAGAAIALPSFAMFKQSSQFSYDLMMIGLTAEMTKKQVADLGGTMVTLSDQTGVSQENMKNAFGFLVAAGQKVGEAQANLKSIGKTAKATGSDIEDVARASFTMGDALKVKPDQMQRAMDMLVQAGKAGNFEFKAMAAELPGLGSSFQALKMTGTEAVATMGSALQIAMKGAKSESEAANNLSNFLSKLMSEETAKKAAKMGGNISKVIRDAQASGANPIEAAIAEINRITKGGDQELISKLFGDMQVQNFIRPMLQNLEEYKKIKQEVLDSQGVVERDWATVMASSKEKTEGLSNSVWGLTKAIGGALDPTVGKLVDKLTPVVQATRDFVTANPKLVGGVIMAAGAFTTMRLAVLATKFAFTFLKGGMLSIVGLFYKTSAAATVAGVGSTAAAGGLTVLGKAFRFVGRAIIWMGRALLMNPIGLAITAIAGLAYVVYENWDTLKPFFTALWDDIVGKFDYAVKKIKGLIDDIKKRWEGLKTLVSGGVGSAWNSTVNTVTSAGNKIGDAWEKTKSWAGFSSGSEPGANTAAPLPNPSLPPLPKIAGSKRSTTITNHNQYDLTINAPPGADPKEIAREAVKELKRQQGISARSMMPDGYVFQG